MRFVRALGEGGMGVVFLAERALGDGLTQRVVVKRPRCDEGAPTPRALDRFADEARALAGIGHGNIVRLLDAGTDAHGPWIALEHVDGVDAHVLMESLRTGDGGLSVEELAWVAHEVARGMTAAHGLCDASGEPTPILHRDLSPQNVLLSRLGEVKVTDFGIAWAVDRSTRTTTGVVVGNLRYIAPEQLEGRAVGAVTDVYGVGRIVEELLEVTEKSGEVEALRAVAAKATRRDPDERYESMAALAAAVVEAVPTLARGGAGLARRVETIAQSRTRVTSAFAGLLAAERADNDRAAVPAKAPTVEAAPRAVPAPTAESARAVTAPAARSTRGPVMVAAAALVVTGALVGFQRARAPGPRAGVVAAGVRAVVAPTPVTPPVVTPEVRAPEVTTEAQEGPVAAPTKVGRRGGRDAVRVAAAADAAVTVVAASAGEPAGLRVNAFPYAMVSVDEGAVAGVPHTFVVPPGEHEVRARFPVDGGFVERRRRVTLGAGEQRPIWFEYP